MKARKITRQSLANKAADRWEEQYKGSLGRKTWNGKATNGSILDALRALGPTPAPDAVDAVIGNGSWTRVGSCDGCDGTVDEVVEVGAAQDYESSTACLCKGCLMDAVRVMEGS